MLRRRSLVALLLVLSVVGIGSAAAGTAWSYPTEVVQSPSTSLDAAAAALRRSPVYSDPGGERALTSAQVSELAARIRDTGGAVFIAVLPSSAAGSGGPNQVVTDLAQRTGLSGTYAVVVGRSFRATSTTLANADEIATSAFQARSSEGTLPVLDEFVQRVGADGSAAGSGASGGQTQVVPAQERHSGGSSGASLVPIAVLVIGVLLLLVWTRRRRRQQAAADTARLEQSMASDRQMLRAQLSVLSDDVMRLEPQVTLHPDARTDYDAAVERYRIAGAALDYADEPVDMVRVQRVVEEASYAMSRARAIVEGRTPPAPPEDLRREGRRQEPALDIDETGTPYYVGGAPFYGGGWYGGGFGGGGLFGGLLLGSILGGGFGGGFGHYGGWGGNYVEINDYGDRGWGGGDGWGDGGGFGGGDWGGGGGGDWGGGSGGDVGGGDW